MGACDLALNSQTSVDAFRGHIMQLADQIRATAANRIIEIYESGEAEQLERIMLEHNINLEVEDTSSLDSYRSYLRDSFFSWVNEYFERGAGLPVPEPSRSAAGAIAEISGDGELSRMWEIEESSVSVDAQELANVRADTGLLGNGVFEHVWGIKSLVQPWTSGAVDIFKSQFLPSISGAINNQVVVAKVLRNVLAANYSMMAFARADVDGIGHDTITALEFEDGAWSGDNDTNATLSIVAGVATIVAGIVALPLSPPIGAAAVTAGGLTILDGSLSTWVAVEETRAEAEGMPLAADTIEGILDNMANALIKVYEQLDGGNQALAHRVLASVGGAMTDDKKKYVAPRPVTFAQADQENVIDMVEGP